MNKRQKKKLNRRQLMIYHGVYTDSLIYPLRVRKRHLKKKTMVSCDHMLLQPTINRNGRAYDMKVLQELHDKVAEFARDTTYTFGED